MTIDEGSTNREVKALSSNKESTDDDPADQGELVSPSESHATESPEDSIDDSVITPVSANLSIEAHSPTVRVGPPQPLTASEEELKSLLSAARSRHPSDGDAVGSMPETGAQDSPTRGASLELPTSNASDENSTSATPISESETTQPLAWSDERTPTLRGSLSFSGGLGGPPLEAQANRARSGFPTNADVEGNLAEARGEAVSGRVEAEVRRPSLQVIGDDYVGLDLEARVVVSLPPQILGSLEMNEALDGIRRIDERLRNIIQGKEPGIELRPIEKAVIVEVVLPALIRAADGLGLNRVEEWPVHRQDFVEGFKLLQMAARVFQNAPQAEALHELLVKGIRIAKFLLT